MELLNGLIEGLVDTGAFMSMMVARSVRELGIMHLVSSNEKYKMASGTITRALGKITNLFIKVGNIQCNMVFLIVDIDSYDILLGLYFLMKIRIVVDVEKGVIQVQNGPKMAIELLSLNVINMLHLVNEQQLSFSFMWIEEGM
jgi:predicted aspartyl protease